MKASLIIASFVMIVWFASADPLITNVNIIDWKTFSNLARVTKLQQITFAYNLVNLDPRWIQYPTLLISFSIPVAQYVQISYKTIFYQPNSCFICTRLVIDKSQNTQFRSITHGIYHDNMVLQPVWLQKGNHQVHVQYRSNCAFSLPIPFDDWNTSYLKIEYFG